MSSIHYPTCCAFLPEEDGPRHTYIGATAACWRRYGEVLTREYSDTERWNAHILTVDAYTAQHPGVEESRTAQSVTLHLASLYLVLYHGVSPGFAGRAKTALKSRYADRFLWLEPPKSLGTLTVLDLYSTRDAEHHLQVAKNWAQCVWDAWHQHHGLIKQLVYGAFDDLPQLRT